MQQKTWMRDISLLYTWRKVIYALNEDHQKLFYQSLHEAPMFIDECHFPVVGVDERLDSVSFHVVPDGELSIHYLVTDPVQDVHLLRRGLQDSLVEVRRFLQEVVHLSAANKDVKGISSLALLERPEKSNLEYIFSYTVYTN